MKKLLVPVDGSKHCLKALDYARMIAQKYGSKIVILNVQEGYIPVSVGVAYYRIADTLTPQESVHPRPLEKTYESGSPEIPKEAVHDVEHEERGMRIAEEAKEHIAEYSSEIDIDVMVAFGKAEDAIIDMGDKGNFDAIIMCTHGMGGLKRFTMGSVTNKVVHMASIPVMVIR